MAGKFRGLSAASQSKRAWNAPSPHRIFSCRHDNVMTARDKNWLHNNLQRVPWCIQQTRLTRDFFFFFFFWGGGGGVFLVQGFFWVMSGDLGIFLGAEFCLHSIIPVIYKPEYPPMGIVERHLVLNSNLISSTTREE